MPAGTLVRSWLLGSAVVGSLAGCSDCFLSGESPNVSHSAPVDGIALWIGDKYAVTGTRQEDCETHANSTDSPQSFSFASGDASVATFSSTGLLTAVAPGNTFATVSSLGMTQGFKVAVSEPVAQVLVTLEPAAPKIGDTVTVRVEARKADGTVAANAQFTPVKLMIRRVDLSVAGVPLPGSTATVARFVVTTHGEYEITTGARRETGQRSGVIKVNVPAP